MPFPVAEFKPLPSQFMNSGDTWQVMLAYIPPRNFMMLAMSEFGYIGYNINDFVKNTPYEQQLVDAMIHGHPIEVPFLELDNAIITEDVPYGKYRSGVKIIAANPRVRVTAHEGRHRAKLSQELDINLIPCRFLIKGMKNWKEYENI